MAMTNAPMMSPTYIHIYIGLTYIHIYTPTYIHIYSPPTYTYTVDTYIYIYYQGIESYIS